MADITCPVKLPSNGKLYSDTVKWKNELRAPRLKDRALGSSSRRNKIQANVLDNTFVEPLGMSAYDLHTADFVYLNVMQRRLSKGAAPYKIAVVCAGCKEKNFIDVPLEELEIKYLQEYKPIEVKTVNNEVLQLSYVTPRKLDECIDRAKEFADEFKDTDLTLEDLRIQELLRSLIVSIDGEKLTPAQMTSFLQNMYADDVDEVLEAVEQFDFGVQFMRKTNCTKCKKEIIYTVPLG